MSYNQCFSSNLKCMMTSVLFRGIVADSASLKSSFEMVLFHHSNEMLRWGKCKWGVLAVQYPLRVFFKYLL